MTENLKGQERQVSVVSKVLIKNYSSEFFYLDPFFQNYQIHDNFIDLTLISRVQFYTFYNIKMDVTTKNFHQVRHFITQKLLPKLLYITYDLQFTGLKFQHFQRDHINSLPFQKYKKLRYVAENYQIIQLGLSFVIDDEHEKKIKIYPYNFYLFPRNPIGYDKNLGMQLSCINFNSQNGMDWNKWIRQGINYIKLSQMDIIQQEESGPSVKDILKTHPQGFKKFAMDFMEKCLNFVQQRQKQQFTLEIHQNFMYQKSFMNLFNAFIKQENLNIAIKIAQSKYLVSKVSPSLKKNSQNKLHQQKYGFGLLFRQIWKKKGLPLIGHNCNLDLLYIYHHLVAPLPENYFQYKKQLKDSQHIFYDTKYIAIKYPTIAQAGSRLEDLVKYLKKEKIESKFYLDKPYDRYNLESFCLHEAGYDSYLTAWVFQQCSRKFDDLQKKCKNKLNITKSFFFINIIAQEDEVNMEYAKNILRFNINVGEKEDVKSKRQEYVKMLRESLSYFQGMFYLHEGFRQIFLEIKDQKPKIIKRLCELIQLKKIKKDEVSTFATYFDWQAERIYREYKKNEEKKNKQQNQKNFSKTNHISYPKKEESSEESSSSRGQDSKKEKKRME